ncbi:PrgI family protein [Candidatus Saccharibacteria bacterium]|nr:PrgI family protein [Candidatus Saccharibacteria bacterium]
MAVYKVPQDVEADDKLLGPFSFRQFIYLIIVAMACGMGYLLFNVFAPLVVIVVPVVIFFGALALPLKKDQPMEAYLSAMISFYFLKPRRRLWQPDGLDSLVQITAPKTAEPDRMKDISEQEARARLSYLSDIVQSEGWAVRGQGVQTQGIADYSQDETDFLGDDNTSAQRFDQMLDTRDERDLSQVRTNFQQQMAAPPPEIVPQLQYNPYPPIHQSVIQPVGQAPQTANIAQTQPQPSPSIQAPLPETTSVTTPSADIIKLANESDGISIASVDKLAHRIEEKQHGLPENEVEISLH